MMFIAMIIMPAQLIAAILIRAVNMNQLTVKPVISVQLIIVTHTVDVLVNLFLALKMSVVVTPVTLMLVVIHPPFLAMMEIIVLMTTVIFIQDVTITKLTVMITMLVLMMIVILLVVVFILSLIVMITMLVPSMIVINLLDAPMMMLNVMIITLALLKFVIPLKVVFSPK
jgi:hypothetical protein